MAADVRDTRDRLARDPIAPGMLTGVYRAVCSIRRAIAVFHGPQGCHENMYAQACFVRDRPDYGEALSDEPFLPSTVLADNDLILGPEDRLTDAAAAVRTELRPELTVIMSSDAAEIIGEDCANLGRQAGNPDNTISVDSGGFKGSWVTGAARTLQALVGLMAEGPKRPRSVNLVGCAGQSVTEAADLAELERLLQRIGVRVNCVLVNRTSVQSIREAPRAELNVVLDEELGLSLAKEMKGKFGMSWLLLPPPLGSGHTDQWLKAINEGLSGPIPDLWRVLADERSRWEPAIRGYAGAITVPPRVGICAEPTLAQGLCRLLLELGVEVPMLAVRTAPGPYAHDLISSLAPPPDVILVEPEPDDVAAALRETNSSLLFGSMLEKFCCAEAGAQLVEMVFPAVFTVGLSEPVVGYAGVSTIARHLARMYLGQVF